MDLKTLATQTSPARILAVSKLQSEEKIRALYHKGQREFGENYVQEALDKIERLQDLTDIHWHLIGHLQKNKAKFVAGKFSLIHSIDSLTLAEALSRQCVSKGVEQNILIQVNIAQEGTKSGFDKESLLSEWTQLCQLPALKICGLMTMPPLTENPEEVRPYFSELRRLRDLLKENTDLNRHPLLELSMGTSHDYAVAVQEGATILRLGTILFGERPSKR